MSVYDEILEKKKQDRIKYRLEQEERDNEDLKRKNDVYATKFYSMQKQIDEKDKEIERLNSIIKEVREYIEKDTRWFDWEYARTYGELCTCKGANSNRLEVLVNPSNLLELLDKVEEK